MYGMVPKLMEEITILTVFSIQQFQNWEPKLIKSSQLTVLRYCILNHISCNSDQCNLERDHFWVEKIKPICFLELMEIIEKQSKFCLIFIPNEMTHKEHFIKYSRLNFLVYFSPKSVNILLK